MSDCVLNELGIVCSLGSGPSEVLGSLLNGAAPGLREPPALRTAEPRFQSRNNRLLRSEERRVGKECRL